MTGKERILATIHGTSRDKLAFMPITMMFAADLIGKPYGEYATNFETLVAGQLAVAEQFEADVVSCISDPAREACDCGARVEIFPDQPPAVVEANAFLKHKEFLEEMALPDVYGGGRMHDRVKAVALFREKTGEDKLIEGWVEGPCAEGADLRGINHLMMDFFEDPDFVHRLFSFTTELGLTFAKAQLEAGADIIGVGDAAASLVGPQVYEEFVWPYEKQLIDGIHAMGGMVRLHICGYITPIVAPIAQLGCELVDVDHMVDLAACRETMGPDQVLVGNLDPVAMVRNQTPDAIYEAVKACHQVAGDKYIIGAGCEIVRDTPHVNLKAMRRHEGEAY